MELFYKYCTISWNSFYKINNLGNVAATPIWKFLLDEPPDCKALSLLLENIELQYLNFEYWV